MPARVAAPLAVLFAVTLAACSSSGGGSGPTAPKTAPAAHGYDLVMFLCAAVSVAPCTARTTDAQTAAIRNALEADPAVRSYRFRSEHDNYRVGRLVLRNGILVHEGDLPASFYIALKDAGQVGSTVQRYSGRPGVSVVELCSQSAGHCS